MAEARTLTPRQRLVRTVGLTVMTVSGVYCLMAAYQAVVADAYVGWQRYALPVGLLLAGFACLTMSADAYDFWMRGRKFRLERIRAVQSAILMSLVVAFLLTVFIIKTALFLWLTPAVLIYVVYVARPSNQQGQAAATSMGPRKDGRTPRPTVKEAMASRGKPVPKQRQRRGGRKHK